MSERCLPPVSEFYVPPTPNQLTDQPIDEPGSPYASHGYTIAYEADKYGNPVPEGGNTAIFAIQPHGMTEPVYVTKPEDDATFTVDVLSGSGSLVRATSAGDVEVVSLEAGSKVVVHPGDAYSYRNNGDEPLLLHDVATPAFKPGDDLDLRASTVSEQTPEPELGFSIAAVRTPDGIKKVSLPNKFWKLISGIENPKIAPEDTVRLTTTTDLEGLKPILEHWVRDRATGDALPEEVTSVLSAIKDSIEGKNDRTYVVTENEDGNVSGVMGMQAPDTKMLPFTSTDYPRELINAYVDPDGRGQGTGKVLAAALEKLAKQAGATEIIVNSGPRYEKTGWKFWSSLYGEPFTTAVGFYGQGGDAKVWRKEFDKQ